MVNKASIFALGVAALSLGFAAWRRRHKESSRGARSAPEPTKKRPISESGGANHSKRHRLGDSPDPMKTGLKGPGAEGKPGSVTDTSALLAAKVAVPEADQGDPEKMGRHYEAIAAKFAASGLNVSAVRDSAKYFKMTGRRATPLDYSEFDTPLARGAVRLGVYRLTDENSDGLASAAHEATMRILSGFEAGPQDPHKFPAFLLEGLSKPAPILAGTVYHLNDPRHYHVTVQMISHPSDPRPNVFVLGDGLDNSRLPAEIPAPTPSRMHAEHEAYREAASETTGPRLQVHSLVFADSGSLLLLFTDDSGVSLRLRSKLRKAFPGSPEKQPTILHVTLARVLTAEQLDSETISGIVASCRRESEKLRGERLEPHSLWHCQENTFTHVNVDESCLECAFQPEAEST